VTPNWEMGPPWGAFCQITLISCSGLLSLPSIALRQDCMETDFSNKFALYCRYATPLTDLRWFFSKYCNVLIRTVVHNVRCVWLTDSCEEVTALSNPHSGCLQPRWAELKTHNGSFHWDYRWVLNLDWCRKSAKKWRLLSFGLSDQRLVIGFQMCCCVSNFVKIGWFFPWDTAIFLASLTEAIAEYWIRTETESQPKSAVCGFFSFGPGDRSAILRDQTSDWTIAELTWTHRLNLCARRKWPFRSVFGLSTKLHQNVTSPGHFFGVQNDMQDGPKVFGVQNYVQDGPEVMLVWLICRVLRTSPLICMIFGRPLGQAYAIGNPSVCPSVRPSVCGQTA